MLVENRPLWPLNLNAQGGAVHIISSADRMLLHPRPRRKTRQGSNRLWMKVQWQAKPNEPVRNRVQLLSSASSFDLYPGR
jgi:hypothetical protein